MLFRNLKPFFIAISLAGRFVSVDAAAISLCADQAQCITWSGPTLKTTTDSCNGVCEYEICLEVDSSKSGCNKNGDTISHGCTKDSSQGTCSSKVSKFGYAFKDKASWQGCQVVEGGKTAMFFLKDGSGCGYGSVSIGDVSCGPSTGLEQSCSGNGVGVECLWKYTAPPCNSTPSPPTPTPPPTPPPTPSPTPSSTSTSPPTNPSPTTSRPSTAPTPSYIIGDPHFKTWAGEKYDFHGACDLVVVQAPDFLGGVGLNIHIRTTRMEGMFSYISAAAVGLGEDIIEVGGDSKNPMYWINGVKGEELSEDSLLTETLVGYPIKFRVVDDENKDFIINLGQNGTIAITTWSGYVGVNIYDANKDNFGTAVGLLGNFEGVKVGRDGRIMNDINAFGAEWQVLSGERKLFHSNVGPQHPEKCEIPTTAAQAQRRLSEGGIDPDAAERACAAVSDESRESCVFDVMATGNLKMARAYM